MNGAAPARATAAPPARGVPAWGWIVLLMAVAGSGFWLGRWQGQRAAGDAGTRRALEARVEVLEKRNAKLNAQLAELEMARRIDRDAYGQVERTLGELQSKLARQGDDLAFYRSIVSPEDGVQGLRIQRFAVRPGTGPREYVIEVTLIQALRQDGLVSGSMQVTLQGMEGTRPLKYALAQLGGSGRTTFSFRYFQTLERTVELPEGFQPFDVEVRAQPGRGEPVRRSFPWQVRDAATPEPEAIAEAPGGVR